RSARSCRWPAFCLADRIEPIPTLSPQEISMHCCSRDCAALPVRARQAVCLVLVSLLCSPLVSAQVVEIAPGQDIQSIVDLYGPGTTFLLKSVIHRLQTIRPRAGDTFQGEPVTILSGARQLTTFERVGRFWVATDQTQQGTQDFGGCQEAHP